MFYAANAIGSDDNKLTITKTVSQGGWFMLLDIGGAAASPYDTDAEASGPMIIANTDITNAPSITTAQANELIVAVLAMGTGPPSGAISPGIFDSIWYTGENDGSQLDSGDGYQHVYAGGAGTVNLGWHIANGGVLSWWSAVAVAFKAVGTVAPFTVSPTGTVDFGTVAVGSSADQVFTVTNASAGTVSGTVSASAPFSIVAGSPFTVISPGGTQNVTVRFSPTAGGTVGSNVNFTADGVTVSRLVTGTSPDLIFTLTVSTAGAGSGTVTSSPAGISCGATCSAPYTSGTVVTLTATPATGSVFTGWSGGCSGTGSCAVTVSAATTVTATFTPDTTAPTVAITAPTSGATYTTNTSPLTLGGTAADNVGVAQVSWASSQGGSGTADGMTSWSTSGIVLQADVNVLTVTARDAAGNTGTATLTVTYDPTAPTVAITAPTAGSTVSGTVNVIASAADNIAVGGVQFKLDGINLGAEVTTAPYSVSWNTTGASNTTHSLTAIARDAAGNTTTSAAVTVTVSNSTATIRFVQKAPQSSQTTVTVAFPAAQTAGNLNVVVVGWKDATATVASVVDSAGNAYALAVGPTVRAGLGSQSIYYAKNILGATANTVTVHFAAAAAFPDIRILEYSGLDPVSPLLATAAASGSGTTAASGSLTTTVPNVLLVAANTVAAYTIGPGTGFTVRVTSAAGDIVEDEVVTATGSYQATARISSGWWVMQLVAFKAAGQ